MAMLPFFRKGQASAKPAIPHAAEPTKTVAPRPEARHSAAPAVIAPPQPPKPPANNGIQVYETGLQLAPEIEEAVMLYANDRAGEACAALNRFILDHPDSKDSLAWHLLFDLYEVTGQRRPFEDLAMDYAVCFESSPPTWRPIRQSGAEKNAARHPTFVFGPNLSPQDKPRLAHFRQECETADTVALDFSKTSVPDDDAYALLMLKTLSGLVATDKQVRLLGGEAFVVRLNASRAAGRLTESTWLLLLLLLQLQAKGDEFDQVALEYAVHFEISPPSYNPPKQVSNEATGANIDPAPAGERFPMRGLLGAGSASVFESLRAFAAPLKRVEIDLSQVTRIDFAVVGLLMDSVMSLAQAGKQIAFEGGNGMVNLLLQVIGVGQFAAIRHEVRK